MKLTVTEHAKFMSIVETRRGDGAGKRQGPCVESLIGDLGLYSKNVGTPWEDLKQGRGLITFERALLTHCMEGQSNMLGGKGSLCTWP